MPKNAECIDSFKETLELILKEFRPALVYEWGPGNSTDTIASFPTVQWVDSVESSQAWFYAYSERKPYNVKLFLEEDLEKYPKVKGRFDKYDLIFIDGKDRERCLKEAKNLIAENGIVILHDAERPQCQDAIKSYKHYYFTDGGHTCILTERDYDIHRLTRTLSAVTL